MFLCLLLAPDTYSYLTPLSSVPFKIGFNTPLSVKGWRGAGIHTKVSMPFTTNPFPYSLTRAEEALPLGYKLSNINIIRIRTLLFSSEKTNKIFQRIFYNVTIKA